MEHSDETQNQQPAVEHNDHFSILVCIDGSDESYTALKYAVRIGSGMDADLTLLYVRPIDQEMVTGGLQFSVARENMLEWGLDLPGMKSLKKARDRLIELEWLGEDWKQEFSNTSVAGDPLGDNITVYVGEDGRCITLKLMVADTVEHGILDECELGEYNITIIAKPDSNEPAGLGYIEAEVADSIALKHSGTVLVTRALEESHGHLLCVTDDEGSIEGALKDAEIAARCMCPIYLFSVATDESELEAAYTAIANAKKAIEAVGITAAGEKAVIGDPVSKIVEEGLQHSVIVLCRSRPKTGWRRLFGISTWHKVLASAKNSVMIVR